MKKEIYEPLAKKIRELVPELMELSFGCVLHAELTGYIQTFGEDVRIFDTVIALSNNTNIHSTVRVLRNYCSEIIEELPFDNYKVVGHPITLDSVLQAINPSMEDISIAEFAFELWEYNKPLKEQSDELGQFLTNILLN